MGRNSKSNSLLRRKQMKSIVDDYVSYLQNIGLKTFQIILKEGGPSSLNSRLEMKKYIDKFEKCFNELDLLEQDIIFNDYIEKKDGFWWMDFFSQATYYRLKDKTIIHFLDIWNK